MTTVSPDFLDLQTALAGEYSLERELGRGGMGVVYLARDVQLDRLVAIKVLPAHQTLAPGARERFVREARTAAGLSHPHIVPIHRVGEAGGFVYFVMSYVAGQTLGERLRTVGPLPPADAMRIMREVSWALAYAHGRGVVHRDVKPDNILLEEGSGRALVTYARPGGAELGGARVAAGAPVRLLPRRPEGTPDDELPRGVVARRTRLRLSIAFDQQPPDWATEGRVGLELLPAPQTHERLLGGLRGFANATASKEGKRWQAVLAGDPPRQERAPLPGQEQAKAAASLEEARFNPEQREAILAAYRGGRARPVTA